MHLERAITLLSSHIDDKLDNIHYALMQISRNSGNDEAVSLASSIDKSINETETAAALLVYNSLKEMESMSEKLYTLLVDSDFEGYVGDIISGVRQLKEFTSRHM